jgi:putative transcriptional regulator
MRNSTIEKAKPARKTTGPRNAIRRPNRAAIRRAAHEAVRIAAAQSDNDVERAIARDHDTFEADPAQLVAIRQGDVDVAGIRAKLGLTQARFAAATGIATGLIADWEQGRKTPSAAARALLLLIDEFGAKALKRLACRAAA